MEGTSKSDRRQLELPLYTRVWNILKGFPSILARGSQQAPETSGTAAAAILSASFGCFCMMINQHITMLSKSWDNFIWSLGAWMPGSHNQDPLYGQIGSYSGKVTILIFSWLVSWIVLHHWLNNRQVGPRTILLWMLVFLIAATVMNWHPLFPYAPLT